MAGESLATVVRPGLSTVQDSGRPGYAHIGVPHSGAWHRVRHRISTELVGSPGGPAVELLAGELVLRMLQSTVIASVGSAELHIDSRRVPGGVGVGVGPQSEVRLEHVGPGPAYLAIAGWEPPRVLGSASADTFSRIGGATLVAGEVLIGTSRTDETAGRFLRESSFVGGPIRVLLTEDREWPDEPWQVLTTTRSGTRLRGPSVPSSTSLPSAPMVVGAVQVTPSGEGIVLGPDSGVTGGYPVVGCVITADVSRVSDLAIGEQVMFTPVSIDEAVAAYEEERRLLAGAVVDPRDLP